MIHSSYNITLMLTVIVYNSADHHHYFAYVDIHTLICVYIYIERERKREREREMYAVYIYMIYIYIYDIYIYIYIPARESRTHEQCAAPENPRLPLPAAVRI